MQFFLTTKTLERNCIMFQNDLYYIYKLTVRKTGQYYIGCTYDLKKRVDRHGYDISSAMTTSDEAELMKLQAFHREAAKALYFDHDFNGILIEREIRKGVLVQVLAIVVGKEPALHLERKYISDARPDILCLNAQ